jgi:flagellar basal body-associated protein FliL
MAQEVAKENAAPKPGAAMLPAILFGVAAVVVSAVLAGVVYLFVLQPLLSPATKEEHAEHAEDHGDPIAAETKSFEFPDETTTVMTKEPGQGDMILQYQVGVICNNEEALHLIEERLTYFKAKIAERHRNRTREELVDPFVQQTIRNQIKQDANTLLKRMAHAPQKGQAPPEVLEVFHLKWTIIPL